MSLEPTSSPALRASNRLPLLVEILVVLVWLAIFSQGIFSSRETAARSEGLQLLTAADEGPGAEWMGIYLQGQKIGCGLADTIKLHDGYRIQERTFLRLRAFEQDRDITTIFVARTDINHHLRTFSFVLTTTPSEIAVQGEVRGRSLLLDIRSAGTVRRQTVALVEIPEISLTFKERILAMQPKVGDAFKLPYFDPASLARQDMEIKIVEEGTAELNGQTVETWTLEASYHGFKTNVVLTKDGRTLEETNVLGMVVRRESRDDAMNRGWSPTSGPVDLIKLSAISLREPIENARESEYLHARLSGGGVEILLKRHEDALQPGEITIQSVARNRWKSYPIPLMDDRFNQDLEATSLIQKDDPKLAGAAKSIIGDTLKAEDAAALINRWVYEKIRKTPVMGVPSALDVFSSRQGDCNEHTTLFTALARAVGIPTRMAAGVVYSDEIGGGPAFYYHAWPEVYLGEWIAIDPTFGQFPADATHIKLVEGDLSDQLALLRVIGNLHIEVLEVH